LAKARMVVIDGQREAEVEHQKEVTKELEKAS
jgi:hypothetical protein